MLAARADRHPPVRGDGLHGARALRPPRDRLRRPRARRARRRRPRRARTVRGPGRRPAGGARRARRSSAPCLAGASMGAHTLLWLALHHPERVAGLVVITPAYDPAENDDPARLARWDALAAGAAQRRRRGVRRRVRRPPVPDRWRETVLKVIRQRLSLHEHPEAVADALQAVPRSRPFADAGGARARSPSRSRRRQRRRGRPGASAGDRGGLRGRDPGRAAGHRRARAARRSPGRAASSRA